MSNFLLQPAPGIVRDLTPFQAGDAWWDGNNVRSVEGSPQPIGGWVSFISSLSSPGVPKNMLAWTENGGTSRLAIATSTKLFIGSVDVSPASIGTVGRWSLDTYGQTLMASPTGGTLYQWSNNTAVVAAEITQAPDVITCMLVRKRQVIAFGCNEEVSTTFNGLCVRWSNIEDPTDWSGSTSDNAGEYVLEGPGRIVTARKVGDYVAILTTDSLWLMEYIGDPGETFRFTRVGSGCGGIGLDAVVSANGTLFWMTQDYLFYVWTPGMIPQQMKCPVQQYVQGLMNTSKTAAQRIFGVFNPKFGEVWFFYPTGSSSSANPTRYAAVSVKDGTWFLGSMARTAMAPGIAVALYGADSSGIVYIHESGNRGTVGDPLTWNIRTGAYYINRTQDRFMLKEVDSDFSAAQLGTVTVAVATYDRPQLADSFTAAQTVTFADSTISRKCLRVSGRLAAVRISGTDATGTTDTFCQIGQLVFDAVKLGQR